MEYSSNLRMGAAVKKLNAILAGEAEVWLIDFSCFISQREGDEITSKIYGAQSKCKEYNDLLAKVYKTDLYQKYRADCRYISDLCAVPTPLEESETFGISPSSNLVPNLVPTEADDEKALVWFQHLTAARLFGSGLVVAKDAAGIQANIFVLFSRPLGVDGLHYVAIDRNGESLDGARLSASLSRNLGRVIREIENLLIEEMMATAHATILRDREVTTLAAHEVRHALHEVRVCKSMEAARGRAIGLAITLVGGLKLHRSEKKVPSISGDELDEIVASLQSLATHADATLTLNKEAILRPVPWWLVYAFIENTRNALKKITGHPNERTVTWELAWSHYGWRATCDSGPYERFGEGGSERSSGNGFALVKKFAEREGYGVRLVSRDAPNQKYLRYYYSIVPKSEQNENDENVEGTCSRR